MGSRSKQAFILPSEFLDLLVELKMSSGSQVVLQYGRKPREIWNGDEEAALAATLVFLAESTTVDAEALADPSSAARLGWVVTNVPQIKDKHLLMIQMGARSDWFDKAIGTVHENKAALKRFDRIWKVVARRLRFPLCARDLTTGAEASYPSVGYSAGAAEWFRSGGHLSQQGVANVEFLVPNAKST